MIYPTGLQAPPDHFFKLSNENNLGNSDLQAHTEYPKNEDHDDNQRDWGPISPVRNPKKPLPMSGAGALEIPQEPVYTEVRR